MKRFTKFGWGFLFGAVAVACLGAATDDSVRKIAAAVERIAYAVEILSKQRH